MPKEIVSLKRLGRETVKALLEDQQTRNDDVYLAKVVFRRLLPKDEKYKSDVQTRKSLRHNELFMVIQAIRIRHQMIHRMYLPTRLSIGKKRGISENDFEAWQTGTAALPGLA